MATDDTLDRELSRLEAEIEAKVDSLFVEMEEGGGAGAAKEEDPWAGLREHFLALEWEIDAGTLKKVSEEIRRLRVTFPEGPLSTLLGWMDRITERIQSLGADLDQPVMKLFHRLKDGLMGVIDDPSKDPKSVVDSLKADVERVLAGEEEAPTITLEAIEEEEGLLFEEFDRAVEEALTPEEPRVQLQEGAPEVRAEEMEEAVAAPEEEVYAEEPGMAVAGAAEQQVTAVPGEEAPAPELPEAEVTDLDRVKASMAQAGGEFQRLVEELQAAGDPLGLNALFQEALRRVQGLSEGLSRMVAALQGRIEALQRLELVPPAPEPAAEPEVPKEEVLFVSVSSRIFGIPLACVRGIFRVPSKAVSQLVQMSEVSLKGRVVPLVSLWRKLGLGRALYTFPKEEKRVLLVSSGTGEIGLLVDRVLARERVEIRPVEGEERSMFRGVATIEKGAFVVDMEAM